MKTDGQSGVVDRFLYSQYTAVAVALISVGVLFDIVARSANELLLRFFSRLGYASGSLLSNMWIPAVAEPITSKLFPAVIIGTFAVGGTIALLIAMAGVGTLVIKSAELASIEVTVHQEYFILTTVFLLLAGLTYQRAGSFEYNSWMRRHPYLFGALAGLVVGIWEFNIYLNIGLSTFSRRVPVVFMHTFTGTTIIGVYIQSSQKTVSRRRKAASVLSAIFLATIVHVWWNLWFVDFTPFWSAWDVFFNNHLYWLK